MAEIALHTLSNQLRVALQPDAAIPQVAISVCYDVGSRNEQPGTSGFAHLFEHMMFQGSQHVPKGEHFKHIHAWGGELNGTTSQDCTNYYESLPAHQLGLGLCRVPSYSHPRRRRAKRQETTGGWRCC